MGAPRMGDTELSRLIRRQRIAKGWARQSDFARDLAKEGVFAGQTAVSQWETAQTVPHPRHWEALSRLLDIPLDVFVSAYSAWIVDTQPDLQVRQPAILAVA